MAGVTHFTGIGISMVSISTFSYSTITYLKCCSNLSNISNSKKKQTPQLIKFAVNGVTELLRLFSNNNNPRSNIVASNYEEEVFINGVDDVLNILKMDYNNAYFVTGILTSSIYAEDCLFADPTINFRGNNVLMASGGDIRTSMNIGVDGGRDYVLATWSLRTFLKLPWRPLIAIEGSTVYDLNEEYKIVRHVERWNVSAVEAIGQIFTASRRPLD